MIESSKVKTMKNEILKVIFVVCLTPLVATTLFIAIFGAWLIGVF